MKKKFFISGVAVFLVVLLCSSSLFAFADSNGPFYPLNIVYVDQNVVSSISSFDLSPAWSISPSKGGFYYAYYAPASSYFLFEAGSTLYYYHNSSLEVYGFNSFPSVGDDVPHQPISISGSYVDKVSTVLDLYRYILPNDYSYYLVGHFGYYDPPKTLWGRLGQTVDGSIASFAAFINGCMSNPVLAICVIVIPVFTLIVSVLFSVIPHRGRVRSKKNKSRWRR